MLRHDFVDKQLRLSTRCANRLDHLVQIYQVGEEQVVERALEMLSSVTNLLRSGQGLTLPVNTSPASVQSRVDYVPSSKAFQDPKDSKLIKMPFDDLTYRIFGYGIDVHNKLGPGHRESIYHRDLEVRFDKAGVFYESEKWIEVYDSDESDVLIGYYIPDFIVEGKVVVEIKALANLDKTHIAQVLGYLATTGCEVGLLLNFGGRSLKRKRILPSKDISQHRVNRQWLFVPDSLRRSE